MDLICRSRLGKWLTFAASRFRNQGDVECSGIGGVEARAAGGGLVTSSKI